MHVFRFSRVVFVRTPLEGASRARLLGEKVWKTYPLSEVSFLRHIATTAVRSKVLFQKVASNPKFFLVAGNDRHWGS